MPRTRETWNMGWVHRHVVLTLTRRGFARFLRKCFTPSEALSTSEAGPPLIQTRIGRVVRPLCNVCYVNCSAIRMGGPKARKGRASGTLRRWNPVRPPFCDS
jgi:hypothetical protein